MFRDLYCDAREMSLVLFLYTSIKFILDTFHDVSNIDIDRNKKDKERETISQPRSTGIRIQNCFRKSQKKKEWKWKADTVSTKISLGLPPKRAKKYSS